MNKNKSNKVLKKLYFIVVLLVILGLLFPPEPSTNTVENNQYEAKGVQKNGNKNITNTSLHSDVISAIIEKNRNEIALFLEKYPIALRWIEISGYDFTKDGSMEIILSYQYVETSTIISYNNVFDNFGNLLFQFVSNDIQHTEIYADETDKKYYIQSSMHISANHDVAVYEEISFNKKWNMELMFAEWDCRDGQERDDNKKEGYAIYQCFTQNEIESILEIGYENMLNIFQIKEATATMDQLEKYVQVYYNKKKEKVTSLGYIYDTKEAIHWKLEQ